MGQKRKSLLLKASDKTVLMLAKAWLLKKFHPGNCYSVRDSNLYLKDESLVTMALYLVKIFLGPYQLVVAIMLDECVSILMVMDI